jgi:hypothetical protein
MSEYDLYFPIIWLDVFFEGNILDVMWLSRKGKSRLNVGREGSSFP